MLENMILFATGLVSFDSTLKLNDGNFSHKHFICRNTSPLPGNSRWVQAMEWSGQKEFVASPDVPFEVDSAEAGLLKSHGPLSFLKVPFFVDVIVQFLVMGV